MNIPSPQDRLLTTQEVVAMVGMHRVTLYRLRKAGLFPEPVRAGMSAIRYKLSDIERWIDSRPPVGTVEASA